MWNACRAALSGTAQGPRAEELREAAGCGVDGSVAMGMTTIEPGWSRVRSPMVAKMPGGLLARRLERAASEWRVGRMARSGSRGG